MKRPLSPHLQIYRLPLLAILSITHRITGVLAIFSLFLILFWILSIHNGRTFFESWAWVFAYCPLPVFVYIGQILMTYHMLNGMRHFIWDNGRALDIKSAERTGKAVIVLSVLLSALPWLVALYL